MNNVVSMYGSNGQVIGMKVVEEVSTVSKLDIAKMRAADEAYSDEMLKFVQKETKRLDRLMSIAIRFVERLKIRGLVSDENEGNYINYVYWQMVEGNEVDEDGVVPQANNMEMMRMQQRMVIVNAINDLDDELELIDKSASSTREFYCVDDSKFTSDDNRKTWMAHDTVTWENEVFDIGYADEAVINDMKDPIEQGMITLENIVYKEAA